MGEEMSVQRMSRREALRSGVAGLLVGMPLVLAAKAALAAPAPDDIAAYTLGSGDKVRVTVFGHEDLSGEFEVDGSGNISLPLIRNIKAEGLTVRQLEQTIAERLSPDYLLNPSVSVEVLNYRPFYIYGEVTKPGSYPFVNGMTVVNAVAMAGGFTYRARTGSVRITRGNEPNRKQITADKDTPVLPGDVIEVPERYF
ncbi:MAG: polysaccharide biosynthesis/export family protein [Rhodospirillales bacterium]